MDLKTPGGTGPTFVNGRLTITAAEVEYIAVYANES
jgi:hypothetical protein